MAYLSQPMLKAIIRMRGENAAFRRLSDGLADRFRRRDVVVRRGLAKGLVFNSGQSNAAYTFSQGAPEPDIEQAIFGVLRSGMTFYDVGANFGWLSVIAARLLGPHGRVFSFEPLDANVRIVEHNARVNRLENVTVAPIALGNTNGSALFL